LSIEVALRVAGIPATNGLQDPFVGFSTLQPLLTVKDGTAVTATPRLRYFNKISFPVKKGPATTRIFCFGGSTTYGRPFDGRTAFPRWLKELLQASCPEERFQVINAGGISYASYRIVPLIREALQFEPDLVIIYTGHNEFLERRTYSTLFDQGRTLVAVRSFLERLHVYQGLKRLMQPALNRLVQPNKKEDSRGASDKMQESRARVGRKPKDKRTLLGEEVRAILDDSAGLELYHRDEGFSRGVVRHFAHNLKAMVTLCRNAGVPVILVEPDSNLKDFSPFKSQHGDGVGFAGRSELDEKVERAARLTRDGKFEESLSLLDEVVRDDPLFADAHYWKGKALIGVGRNRKAHESLIRARDLDVCPLRATSPILDEIRKVGASGNTVFVRFREVMKKGLLYRVDKTGIPGNDCFMDHVHPVIRGHQMLAETLLDEIVALGLFQGCRKLTDAERGEVNSRVMKSLSPDFLATKDLNLAKVLRWAGKKQEAKVALLRAAKLLEDNPEIHKILANFHTEEGNHQAAIRASEKAVRLSGDDPLMIYSLAVTLYESGAKDEAVEMYKNLVKRRTRIPAAYSNLGIIHLEEGRAEEALNVLETGLETCPDSSPVLGAHGLALAVSGKPAEGIPWMVRALEIDPGNPDHLYNLAAMYSLTGSTNEALRSLDLAVSKGYSKPEKIAGDPAFEPLRNHPLFKRILTRLRRRWGKSSPAR